MSFFQDVINIVAKYYPQLLSGVGNTMLIALTGTVAGLAIGLLTGIGGSVLFSARRGGGQSDNEANEYFTVGFYPQEYRRDLMILGSKSGRDGDKVALTHLTPRAVEHGVTFAQAKLTLICKKIYRHDMELANIPADAAKAYYAEEAPHTIYIGEVVGFVES